VIEYMSRQPDGAAVVPDGFERLWASVWAAQQSLKKDRDG